MSLVTAAPELMTSAATDLANVGSTINAAHMAAANPTVAVIPAAADEVSSSIAHLFSQHAQAYQAQAGQAAAFHEQFVQRLTSSAGSYASAEHASAAALQSLTPSAALPISTIEDILLTIATPFAAIFVLPILALAAVAIGLVLAIFAVGAIPIVLLGLL
jgi:PE family